MEKGFQLVTASSGSEALILHRKHCFDLILADLELDDMDGRRLCSEVRAGDPAHQVPIILICIDTPECLEKVRQSDATAMILRPINPTQLLMTIGSFIEMQLARSKRVAFLADVLTKTADTEFYSHSRDISATGILIETEHRLSVGENIVCDFQLFDAIHTRAAGEVARCVDTPRGSLLYGIKFVDLPMAKRSAIEKYVASHDHLEIVPKPHHLLGKSLP